jgi:hypothetical protein
VIYSVPSCALRSSLRPIATVAAVVLALGLAVGSLAAQAPDREALDAYYRAVGQHFGVSPGEVIVLSEWRLPPDEIPVVLFVADRGGISPDAVVALRRGGTSWPVVARRYALDAGSFHVRIDGAAGSLGRLYEEYAARPPAQWSSIQLADADVVALVNLRVLSEVLRRPPLAVLQARDRAGSWVAAYRALSSGR